MEFIERRQPARGDTPPTLPGFEWRRRDEDDGGGWNLWEFLGKNDQGHRRFRYAGWLSPEEWDAIKQQVQVKSDQDSSDGHDLDAQGVAEPKQADDAINGPGESLVTQAQNPPAVPSDSSKKKPAPRRKRVTSDSHGVKPRKLKVLPFRQKAVSHTKSKEKEQWEIKECGCRLPKFPKWEWRDFENGHRLLMVIGYGKSKNNKRVKKRDCVRYYTHAAMKDFWENEYAKQINGSAKA